MLANRKIILDKTQETLLKQIDGNPTDVSGQEFYYTGAEQLYKVPEAGYYRIDLDGSGSWASGGGSTSGIIYLEKGQNLYFYVGAQGPFNVSIPGNTFGYGGGATDVRLVGGVWNNTASLNSRIMVAGGGGGNDYSLSKATDGGGLVTDNTYKNVWYDKFLDTSILVKGATQEQGGIVAIGEGNNGSFGMANPSLASLDYGGVGGGGYYGGASLDSFGAATGGNSFISGYAGSNAITSASSQTPTNQVKHYSGLYFINGKMGIGRNRLSTGKARITYVGLEKPKRVNTTLDAVRYVKDCINQNSINRWNHFTELQVVKDGINLAKGKTVTGDIPSSTVSRITDGKLIEYADSTVSGATSCITLDLGKTESVDEIAVWHYYEDNRQYFDHTLSVSTDNKNYKVIHNTSPFETSLGIRVSAYTEETELKPSMNASSLGQVLKSDQNIVSSIKTKNNIQYITGKNPDNYIWYMGILWRAYALEEGAVTLISDEIVSFDQYYTKAGKNDYTNSLIRKWLNNYFYAQLPYAQKKDLLLHSFCIDSASSSSTVEQNCSAEVRDYVGLLTLAEYNFIGGANSYLHKQYRYWLGTVQAGADSIYSATKENVSLMAAEDSVGIRPVISIREDISVLEGKGTLQNPYFLYAKPGNALRGEFGIYFEYDNIKWRLVDAEMVRNGSSAVQAVKAIYADASDKLPSYAFETASISNAGVYTPSRSTNIASKMQSFKVSKNQLLSPTVRLGFQDYDQCLGSMDCALRGYKTDTSVNSDAYTTPVTSTIFLPIHGEIFTGFDSYNQYDAYWTMTPRTGGALAWRIRSDGLATSSSAHPVTSVLKARPVIFLKWSLPMDCSGSRNGTYQHPCLVST